MIPARDERVVEAEEQVLGALLTGSERVVLDVFDEVRSTDFDRVTDQQVVECISRMLDENQPISPVTVGERLGSELRRIGGMSRLLDLHGKAPIVSSNAAYLARTIVRPAARLRALHEAGTAIARLGESDLGVESIDEIVDSGRALLDSASVARRTSEQSVEQDVWSAMTDLEASDDTIGTPWRELTLAIGGWMPGCLYIVGGRPGIGKSVVGTDVLLDAARRQRWSHLASVEMSKSEVYKRLLCNVASVDHERMMHRTLTQDDWGDLGKAAKHIASLPLSVDENPAQRVADIRARARSLARRGRLGVIVVDYLQLMQGSGKRAERREQEVAQFSRSLKLLAKELHVPVVALSQLNRGPEQRHDKMPQLSDLRESGALEQDADGVLLLHRDDEEPNVLLMFVAKSRHGRAGRVLRMTWRGEFSRVEDYVPTPTIGSYYDEPETA